MGIDFETFYEWAKDRFGEENVKIKGEEILTNSVFTEDSKFHLWMNPSGGKRKLSGGAYRCWYTDRMGSLISLVAEVDRIPYDEAEELLTGTTTLRGLERKLNEIFGATPEEEVPAAEVNAGLQLPAYTYPIEQMAVSDPWRQKAVRYLEERKISPEGLYVATRGKYKNRIVLPYYNIYGRLVYYNARTMGGNKLRYMKPDDENLQQTEVLFVPKWPKIKNKIYLTEGEFDALSLYQCGFFSAAFGGKEISDSQIEMLRHYIPVLAFDTDQEEGKKDAGGEALLKNGLKLLSKGFTEVHFVRPPCGYKDWNALLVQKDESIVRKYIEQYSKPFTGWTAERLRAAKL